MLEEVEEFSRQFLTLYRRIIECFAGIWEQLMLSQDYYYLRVFVIGILATVCFLVVLGYLADRVFKN